MGADLQQPPRTLRWSQRFGCRRRIVTLPHVLQIIEKYECNKIGNYKTFKKCNHNQKTHYTSQNNKQYSYMSQLQHYNMMQRYTEHTKPTYFLQLDDMCDAVNFKQTLHGQSTLRIRKFSFFETLTLFRYFTRVSKR